MARGLECKYQIRNHRSKRSLRNELNALKQSQRLQENLLSALQDPQRRETALRLLDTDDPLSGAAKLWLKDEVDLENLNTMDGISAKFSDDGQRSTTGSPSPFPEAAALKDMQPDFGMSPRNSKISPVRTDAVPMNQRIPDQFSMTGGPKMFGHDMNPFAVNKAPVFQQFPPSFAPPRGAPNVNGVPYQGPNDGSVDMFAPAWLDPSLTGDNGQSGFPQQNDAPFQQMPTGDMRSWQNMGGPMMEQGRSMHHSPHSANLTFDQWDSPQVEEKKLPGAVANSSGLPFSPASMSTSLPTKAAFAPQSSETMAPRQGHRTSVSSVTSTGQPRSQSRERHRLASARNWHKQKQATADLQATKARVEAQHAALKEEYSEVLSQVQQVKHALLGHANCGDPAIKMWLHKEASGVLTGYQNPLTDGEAVDARHDDFGDGASELPYPTPTSDDQRAPKLGRTESDDVRMGGVERSGKA